MRSPLGYRRARFLCEKKQKLGERELKRFRRPFLKRPQGFQRAEIVALKLAFQGSTGAFQRVLIATTLGIVALKPAFQGSTGAFQRVLIATIMVAPAGAKLPQRKRAQDGEKKQSGGLFFAWGDTRRVSPLFDSSAVKNTVSG